MSISSSNGTVIVVAAMLEGRPDRVVQPAGQYTTTRRSGVRRVAAPGQGWSYLPIICFMPAVNASTFDLSITLPGTMMMPSFGTPDLLPSRWAAISFMPR